MRSDPRVRAPRSQGVGNQRVDRRRLSGFSALEDNFLIAGQASNRLPHTNTRTADFVGTRGAPTVHNTRPGALRPWPPAIHPRGRLAVTLAARRCRTAAPLLAGPLSDPALRESPLLDAEQTVEGLAFLPLPPKQERVSVARALLSKHRYHGRPCGWPDARVAHEEPPRLFRRARHEDGPAVSGCPSCTLE